MALKDRSRDELVAEAVARGVQGATFLTKAELLRVLGQESPSGFLTRARGWLAHALTRFDAATPEVADDFADRVEHEHEVHFESSHPAAAATDAEEPIRTRTMARLLAEQGHADRALAITSEIGASDASMPIGDAPTEATRTSAATVALALDAAHAAAQLGLSRNDDAQIDALSAHPIDARSIFAVWSVSARARARAERVLGEAGVLTLRVSTWHTDVAGKVTSTLKSRLCERSEGETQLGDLTPNAACLVAIGLSGRERFVAIAHVPRFTMPPDAPDVAIALDAAPSTAQGPAPAPSKEPSSDALAGASRLVVAPTKAAVAPAKAAVAPAKAAVAPTKAAVAAEPSAAALYARDAGAVVHAQAAGAALQDDSSRLLATARTLSVDQRAPQRSLSFVRQALHENARSSDLSATATR